MSKSVTKAKARSAAIVALISGASDLGYEISGGFEAAVASARKLVPSDFLKRTDEQRKAFAPLIRDFGEQFKAGHLLRYLETRGYEKRLGNQDRAQRIEAMVEIMGKPEPTSDKSNRRTELEHKGVKAAQNAWTRVRDAAGLKPKPEKRTPLRRAAGDEKESKAVPTAALTPPKFTISTPPIDVIAYFDKLSADLVYKAVNANAAFVPSSIKSAVQDFRKAIRAAVATARASKARSAKAKASKGTVSIAAVASAMQNGTGKPNGAAAN